MATTTQNFDIHPLDLVYAVSQQHLNASLATYFMALNHKIEFNYYIDDNGNYVPTALEKTPDISFSGTVFPVVDSEGNVKVDLIDMSAAGALQPNQVRFQLTFAPGATFSYMGRKFRQDDPLNAPWVISMTTNLTSTVLSDNIPEALREQLALLMKNYGEVFSLQQIATDLATASAAAGIANKDNSQSKIGQAIWSPLVDVMVLHLKANAAAGKIPLGYVITKSTPAAATSKLKPTSTPELTPTSAQLVVVPNKDTPALSALVFPMMTQDRAMPTNFASLFSDVSLFGDVRTAAGVAIVSTNLVRTVLRANLDKEGVTAKASQFLKVAANSKSPTTYTLAEGTGGIYEDTNPTGSAPPGTYLSFSFAQRSSDSWSFLSAHGGGTSSMQCNFSVSGSTASKDGGSLLTLKGTYRLTASETQGSLGWQMPWTTFPWSIQFVIGNSNTPGSYGAITFTNQNEDFGSTPQPEDPSSWEKFLDAINPFVSMAKDIGGIRGHLSKLLQEKLRPALIASFAPLNKFVMIGGNVFTFSNVHLNSNYLLVTDIAYQSPTAAPSPPPVEG
ncbi:MAG: hypothetical protein ACJ8AT_05145 [Hyalangium sp.]|uniref:hypothetical protein n=1 Tax=Hyalangium sp. TaxID=2028555 RepID=UPI00389AEAAF